MLKRAEIRTMENKEKELCECEHPREFHKKRGYMKGNCTFGGIELIEPCNCKEFKLKNEYDK